jgi:hypothetical protein
MIVHYPKKALRFLILNRLSQLSRAQLLAGGLETSNRVVKSQEQYLHDHTSKP